MIKYNQFSTNHHIELNPNRQAEGAVIWLHGLGANGDDFVPIVNELKLQDCALRFIFPHAPNRAVTINGGYVMPAWFDIYSLQTDQLLDNKGIEESCAQIAHYIEAEVKRGIPTDKIVLAGFSQGAVIALLTGLRYQNPLASIIALSGYLPQAENFLKDPKPPNQTLPIFIGHGEEDTVIPFQFGEATAHFLQKKGYPVSFHPYAMPHSVCPAEINDIHSWLRRTFNKTST